VCEAKPACEAKPRSNFQRSNVSTLPRSNVFPLCKNPPTLSIEIIDIQGDCPVYQIGDSFRIEAGDVDLVSSSVLEYENSRNPFPWRRSWVTHCNELAKLHQSVNVEIKQRAEELEQDGLKAMDALHVACAEGTESDYFLTCNDRIIQRYNGENLRVLNPVNFVLEVPGDE
jgi:hypothetical protein